MALDQVAQAKAASPSWGSESQEANDTGAEQGQKIAYPVDGTADVLEGEDAILDIDFHQIGLLMAVDRRGSNGQGSSILRGLPAIVAGHVELETTVAIRIRDTHLDALGGKAQQFAVSFANDGKRVFVVEGKAIQVEVSEGAFEREIGTVGRTLTDQVLDRGGAEDLFVELAGEAIEMLARGGARVIRGRARQHGRHTLQRIQTGRAEGNAIELGCLLALVVRPRREELEVLQTFSRTSRTEFLGNLRSIQPLGPWNGEGGQESGHYQPANGSS